MNILAGVLVVVALSGCATKKGRLWIDPPVGTESRGSTGRNLYYRVENLDSGKKESLVIPIEQAPEHLVVENKQDVQATSENTFAATKADRLLKGMDMPAAGEGVTVSYLRGIESVEKLYRQRKFHEALVQLAPLVQQYPGMPRLLVMQGTLYRKIGEKKLALDAFRKAQKLSASDSTIEDAVSRLQEETGDVQ